MLAGREGPRIRRVPLERDESAFAREDVRFVRLEMPERTQPHGVDADKAEVADPREECRWSLCERAEGRSGPGERVLSLGVHPADLAHDRREYELDRLDGVEAAAKYQAAQRRIDVLRVAATAGEGDAERRGLVAKPRDRVDLSVVRERREGLHAFEARRGVRRIAVVAERHRRREAWVRQVGEVRRELLRMTAQLVDDGAPREAHDRGGRQALDLHAGAIQAAAGAPRWTQHLERGLPEARLAPASSSIASRSCARAGPTSETPIPSG